MQSILREFQEPSKTGMRVPTYPDLQRTALYPQMEQGTFSVNHASSKLVLVRDATFPLWGTQHAAAYLFYSQNWETGAQLDLTIPNADWSILRLPYVLSEYQSGANTTATYRRFNVGGPWVGPVAGCPLVTMPEVDDRPWLWIPPLATIVVGVSFGPSPTIVGSIDQAAVFLECRTGPENEVPELGGSHNSFTGTAFSVIVTRPSVLSATGCYVRPGRVEIKNEAAGDLVLSQWRLEVTIGVSNTPTLAVSEPAPNVLGTLSQSTPLGSIPPVLLPMVNLSAQRSVTTNAATLVAAAAKVVSTALVVTNATKVMNQEGTINCCRIYEQGQNGSSFAVLPESFAAFMPDDRAFYRMAAGVATAVRPSSEFERFQDYRQLTSSPIESTVNWAATMRLWRNQHIHVMLFVDQDLTTPSTMAYTLRQNLEFVTNDVLLRPAIASADIEDLHKAVRAFARAPVWRPAGTPAHYNLVSREVEATPRGRPKPKPKGKPQSQQESQKPKPKPKPKAKAASAPKKK